MKLKTKLNLLLNILFAAFLIMPILSAHAAGVVPCGDNDAQNISNVVNGGYSTSTESTFYQQTCQLGDIFKIIARAVNFFIGASGIYAVLRIIMGAIGMITAAGNEESISSARKTMQNAVIGVLIVLLAYVLANSIFAIFGPKVGVNSNGFLYNPFQ